MNFYPIPNTMTVQKGNIFLGLIIGVVLVLIVGGAYYFGTQKTNNSNSTQPVNNPVVTTPSPRGQNILYALYHGQTISGYDLGKNPNLQRDDYTEIYQIDTNTKEEKMIYSDQRENFSIGMIASHDNFIYVRTSPRKQSTTGVSSVYIIDLTTQKATPAPDFSDLARPSFSIDGKFVAFQKDNGQPNSGLKQIIAVKNLTTSETKELVDLVQIDNTLPSVGPLAISPDNQNIAVTSGGGIQDNQWSEVFVINIASGKITKLVNRDKKLDPLGKPIWLDNNNIVLALSEKTTSAQNLGNIQIYKTNLETKDLKKVYTLAENNQKGTVIAVDLDTKGETAIYTLYFPEPPSSDPQQPARSKSEIRKINLKTNKSELIKSNTNLGGINFTSINYIQ